MKHNLKQFFGIFLTLSLCISSAFGIDIYVSELYQEIDIAFLNHSDVELDRILGSNQDDENYYLLENYTLKKIRRLVVKKDYEFALQTNLIVIDNNLDNSEAVEMYSIIANALEEQKKIQQHEEALRLAEKAKLEEEMQRQRILVTKEFSTAVNQTGDSVFLRSKDERYSASTWNFMFGMFNGVLVSDSANSYNSFRYGISADYNYEYFFDTLSVGFDVNADAIILPFTNGDDTILGSFGIVPKFGFTKLSKNLFFRVGFGSILRGTNSDKTTLHETLFSPVFGVGVNNIKLGSIAFSGNYDYYLGHLAYSDLNSAMSAKVNFAIPIGEMQKVKLNLNVGLKDTLLIKADGIENRAGIVLAIGAENVIK